MIYTGKEDEKYFRFHGKIKNKSTCGSPGAIQQGCHSNNAFFVLRRTTVISVYIEKSSLESANRPETKI